MKTLFPLVFVLAIGCASSNKPLAIPNSFELNPPEAVIKALFVERPKDPGTYERPESWPAEMRRYFGGELGPTIDGFAQVQKEFVNKYARWELPCRSYERYLALSTIDPITTCPSIPLDIDVNEEKVTSVDATFRIGYKLQGTAVPFRRRLSVTLARRGDRWLITKISYSEADFHFLGNKQSMRGFLTFLTLQLSETMAWAEKHSGKLLPRNPRQRFKVREGIFDSP